MHNGNYKRGHTFIIPLKNLLTKIFVFLFLCVFTLRFSDHETSLKQFY